MKHNQLLKTVRDVNIAFAKQLMFLASVQVLVGVNTESASSATSAHPVVVNTTQWDVGLCLTSSLPKTRSTLPGLVKVTG